MPPKYCPKCKNEILPYLRSGELKEITFERGPGSYLINRYLVSYQLYSCISCKTIYYKVFEKRKFEELDEEFNPDKERRKENDKRDHKREHKE